MAGTTLDQKLMEVMSFMTVQKEDQNDYLCTLKEMLDVYLLSVIEEEDPLYALLYQKNQYASSSYESIKAVSIDSYQLNLVFALPFLPEHVEILYTSTSPGYVEIKLPPLLDDHVQYSKIWREACYKGVQNSLQRHLRLWKDDDNYLLQTAFNKWFSKVVDKGLQLADIDSIPNFEIRRLQNNNEVILQITDREKNHSFTVSLLPVISFPSAHLPESIMKLVPTSDECDEWVVESRPHPSLSPRLWAMSLWQHERKIIHDNTSVKYTIQLLQVLRDGCQWRNLKNYHLKTLILLEHEENPSNFGECRPATLLINMLLKLRDRLVSKDGIPCIWDKSYNVLSGLTGQQRAELARAVTNIRDELQRCERDYSLDIMRLFRPPTMNDTSEPEIQRRSSSSAVSSLESHTGSPETPQPTRPLRDSISNTSQTLLTETPRYHFRPESAGGSSRGQAVDQEENNNGWLWAAGAVVAGAGILGAILSQRKSKN